MQRQVWVIMVMFLSIVLCGALVQVAANNFPKEFPEKIVKWKKSDGGNGHWYQAVFVPEGIGWVESQLRATAHGCDWHLATITSPEEDEFVFGLIANDAKFFPPESPENGVQNGPWLGGFQRDSIQEPDGNWRWTTSESFQYTNWSDGEPNNTTGPGVEGIPDGSPEDFLLYLNTNQWNDAPGTLLQMGYLIELDVPRRHCGSKKDKRR